MKKKQNKALYTIYNTGDKKTAISTLRSKDIKYYIYKNNHF